MILAEHGRYEILLLAGRFLLSEKMQMQARQLISSEKRRRKHEDKTDFLKMKQEGEPIVMLTAYDYPAAKLAEQAGVDMILVGDSLGMVVLGLDSTVSVTVADMIHHTKAVKRGAKDTFVVTDMPLCHITALWKAL